MLMLRQQAEAQLPTLVLLLTVLQEEVPYGGGLILLRCWWCAASVKAPT